MRFLILPVLAVSSLLLVACDDADCHAVFIPSVSLEIEDSDGEPITDATVRYSVDGGAFADCDNLGSGNYSCGDQEGAFVIEIEAGEATDTLEFDIAADECRAINQSATVVLDPG